ncbi:MAG: zinc ribbon domain-containing protein [Candidatus Dadabacteria bacterium]|nr:zinc ribbon domain-containing protein [Candidatus Dadabacteria bacterium]MCY4261927.1 zinc ribbon domain-containing protein [Candidatus Dadabacteria bacterium]
MPIYEYDCHDCKKTVSIFFLTISEAEDEQAVCPECGQIKLKRVLSSTSLIRAGMEPKKINSPKVPKNDSSLLAETMKKESRRSGRDYGDDFKEVAKRLEKGEKADSIEKSLRARVGEKMQAH